MYSELFINLGSSATFTWRLSYNASLLIDWNFRWADVFQGSTGDQWNPELTSGQPQCKYMLHSIFRSNLVSILSCMPVSVFEYPRKAHHLDGKIYIRNARFFWILPFCRWLVRPLMIYLIMQAQVLSIVCHRLAYVTFWYPGGIKAVSISLI